MKTKVIALLLSIVLASGCIGAAPVFAAEPGIEETAPEQEEAPEESELLTAPVVADEEPLPDFPDVSGEEEKEEAASEPEEDDDDEGINLLAPLPNRNKSS